MILLYLGWALVCVLCAWAFLVTFNPWAGLMALSFPLVVGGPQALRQGDLLMSGLADRFTVFGGQVERLGGDPAGLLALDSRWDPPRQPRRFSLALPGTSGPVTFSVTSVVVPGGTREGVLAEVARDWTACPGAADPSGLWRLEAGAPQAAGCPAAPEGGMLFYAAPAPALVRCAPDPGQVSLCAMDLLAGGMEVTVTFGAADLGLWQAMQAGVEAALEAGFRAVPDAS